MSRASSIRLKALRWACAACALVGIILPASAFGGESDRIILTREAGLTAAERAALRDRVDGRLIKLLSIPHTEVLAVPAVQAGEALRRLRHDSSVRSAEPDVRVAALADPALLGQLYGLQRIAAPAAWSESRGRGADVAVVDTGLTFDDPELTDGIAVNPSDPVNGVDDDGNGKTDDAHGWDFVDGDNAPEDEEGHGTFVAGIIAADGALSGVAPDARVLPLRALDEHGEGYLSDIAAAFDYAGARGVPIVNASLGMRVDKSPTIDRAFAAHPRTLYVTAAGNDGTNNDSSPTFPCASQLPNVVCVAASDRDDKRAAFSNVGRTTVDLFAPGVDILSTLGGSYAEASGTSFAAPHVAGVAALVLAHSPTFAALELKNAVLASVDPISSLAGLALTGGRVNALRALTVAPADEDGDGIASAWDDCRAVADPMQVDSDRDGIGDACEPPSSVQAPNQATAPNGPSGGCATSSCSAPRIEHASVRVTKSRRRLVASARLNGAATIYVTAARRRCADCRQRTVSARRFTTTRGTATLRLGHDTRRRFPRGRYRVRFRIEDVLISASPVDRILQVR